MSTSTVFLSDEPETSELRVTTVVELVSRGHKEVLAGLEVGSEEDRTKIRSSMQLAEDVAATVDAILDRAGIRLDPLSSAEDSALLDATVCTTSYLGAILSRHLGAEWE